MDGAAGSLALAAAAGAAAGAATWCCLAPRDHRRRNLPKRILIVRHGESEGNVDKALYNDVADHQLVLTPKGEEQAREAGRRVREIVGDEDCYFIVSPFERAMLTYVGIASQLGRGQNKGLRIDARIREQEWGNFQTEASTEDMERERRVVGNYFYRFHTGESGADLEVRIGAFFSSFYRHCQRRDYSNANVVLVAHGLTNRAILSRFFRWPPRVFDTIKNPKNGEVWTLVKDGGGKYQISRDYLWKDAGESQPLKATRGAPIVYKKIRLHLVSGEAVETVVSRFDELPADFIVEPRVPNFDALYALIAGNAEVVAAGIREPDIAWVNMLYSGICDEPSEVAQSRKYTMTTTSFKTRDDRAVPIPQLPDSPVE